VSLLGDELRFALITSKAVVKPIAEKTSNAKETNVSGIFVEINKSAAKKCERCWHFIADVGSNESHPEICGRCIENIDGAGEIRHFV